MLAGFFPYDFSSSSESQMQPNIPSISGYILPQSDLNEFAQPAFQHPDIQYAKIPFETVKPNETLDQQPSNRNQNILERQRFDERPTANRIQPDLPEIPLSAFFERIKFEQEEGGPFFQPEAIKQRQAAEQEELQTPEIEVEQAPEEEAQVHDEQIPTSFRLNSGVPTRRLGDHNLFQTANRRIIEVQLLGIDPLRREPQTQDEQAYQNILTQFQESVNVTTQPLRPLPQHAEPHEDIDSQGMSEMTDFSYLEDQQEGEQDPGRQ